MDQSHFLTLSASGMNLPVEATALASGFSSACESVLSASGMNLSAEAAPLASGMDFLVEAAFSASGIGCSVNLNLHDKELLVWFEKCKN